MLLKATCKKCKNSGMFDIGNMTKEQVLEHFKNQHQFHCAFGNHVELDSPINYYEFDFNNLVEGSAPTEFQFQSDLRHKYSEVLTTKELQEQYVVESFFEGHCMCHPKDDEDGIAVFTFCHSPAGERYYLR